MSIAEQLMEEGRLEGWETGLVKGREEGREEGQALSLRVSLRRILRHRFGELPMEAVALIEAATAADLTAWIDVALDAPTMAQACAAFRGKTHS